MRQLIQYNRCGTADCVRSHVHIHARRHALSSPLDLVHNVKGPGQAWHQAKKE